MKDLERAYISKNCTLVYLKVVYDYIDDAKYALVEVGKSVRNLIKCIQVAESREKIQVAILSLESLPEDISGFNRHILFSEEY